MNKLLRYLLLICVVVLCGGASYGETATLKFTKACRGSGTDSQNNTWTITSDSKESVFDKEKGIHYGTSSAAVSFIKATTSSFVGTMISKIVVNASAADAGSPKVSCKVGGEAFGGEQSLGTANAAYTFTGMAKGDIEVVVSKKSTKKALYLLSVEVTYVKSSKEFTTLSFGEGLNGKTYNCTVGDNFAAPTATLTPAVEGAKITYSSDKPEVATVDASTGTVTWGTTEGTAVITASYAGNDKYEASTVSYTINLTKPFEVEDGVFDFTESCDYGSGLTPTNDNNAENATSSKWTAKNVSFETSGGKGVRWWINGTANELRVYGNTKFKISVPEGNFITLIDIDGVNSGFSVDSGTFKSGKWSGCSQTVVFTNGSNRKDIKKITVKYIAKESVTPTTNGYATFACSYPVNYSENGLKAYTIKVDEDNQKVAYTEFTGVVPEGMAVLVSGTKGQKYELTPDTEKADAAFTTDLKVSDGTVKSDGTNFYGFTTKDGVSGFVRVAKDVAVPQGKGYLQLTGNTAAAPVFYSINIGGGTTGIGQVEVEKAAENGAIYNLAGQRVDASYKGVVIKNGKKYVNK